MYDPTTNTLTVNWDHADGPVVRYRITYAPTTGDPIEEFVSRFPDAPPGAVRLSLGVKPSPFVLFPQDHRAGKPEQRGLAEPGP